MKRFVKTSTLVAASVLACSTAFAANNTTASSNATTQSVTTGPSPLLAWPTAFDGSDTLAFQPGYDFNLFVLNQHSAVASKNALNRPLVNISGRVAFEGDYYQNGVKDTYYRNLSLDAAKLDISVDASKWVSGVIETGIDADNIPVGHGIAIQQAFFNIGNLNENPFFFTAGNFYQPFGRYANYLVGNTVTTYIGQTHMDALDAGYSKNGLTMQAYGYNGAYGSTSSTTNHLFDGGVDARYSKDFNQNTLIVGAGYSSNLANADSIRAATTSTNVLDRRVAAVDANARFETPMFDFMGEYVAALDKFAAASGSTFTGGNGSVNGAQPKAADLEAIYKTQVKDIPLFLGVDYGHTASASGYQGDFGPLPENSYTAIVDANLWKNTALLLQYSYNKNYATATKSTANVVETQFNVYF